MKLSSEPRGTEATPVGDASRCREIDPAAPMLFIINAASGRHAPEATGPLIEEALRSAGRSGELLFTHAGELEKVARRAAVTAAARRSALVAVGGDGTINAVAQAAHAQGCNLGVVPMGTFNYFARSHGIPTEAAEAALALFRFEPVPVQVAQINERVFLVNASLGLYPELLQDREAYKVRFGRSRVVAFSAALATLLGAHRQLKLRIELGAGAREVTTPTLFVGNNRLQLERVGLQEAPALDEGCIAAVMLRPIGNLAMLWLTLRGAIGTLGSAADVESFRFHRMVVRPRLLRSGSMVKVAYDGEIGRLAAPLEFRVSPKPLYILKPATTGSTARHDPGNT
jgi:diacylglycerol kinase family enzyme